MRHGLHWAYQLFNRPLYKSSRFFPVLLHNSNSKLSRKTIILCQHHHSLFIHAFKPHGVKNMTTKSDLGDPSFQNMVMFDGELDGDDFFSVPEPGKGRLYPDTDDPHIGTLSQATNAQQIFDWVKSYEAKITPEQAAEALATLWELQKAYCHHTRNFSYQGFVKGTIEYSEEMRNHPQFATLVQSATSGASLLNDNALTHVILFLRRFGVQPWDEQIYPLLLESFPRISNFELSALSRWCVACRDFYGTGRLLLAQALPRINQILSRVTNADELKLAAACINSTLHLLDKDTVTQFNRLTNKMIDDETINNETSVRTLLKVSRVLQTLEHPDCFQSSLRILQLVDKSPVLEKCTVIEIVWLIKQLETAIEPTQLIQKAERLVCRMLEDVELSLEHIELLTFISQWGSISHKAHVERFVRRVLTSTTAEEILPYLSPLYRLIRRTKLSDTKLVDRFWHTVIRCLDIVKEPESQRSLLYRCCHWYMYFNNNMGGTYRLKVFESRVLSLIEQSWNDYDVMERAHVLSKFMAFVVAYGDSQDYLQILEILQRTENQLDGQDVESLSRGLQIAFSFHRNMPQSLAELAVNMSALLERRTKKLLESSKYLIDSVSLLRAQNSRRISIREPPSVTSEMAYSKCLVQMDQLNFRNIRDLMLALMHNRVLHVDIMNHIGDFLSWRIDQLSAYIACKFVVLCYELGYVPPQFEKVLPQIAELIFKNGHRVSGLNLVHSALGLILFQNLPMDLVRSIFSVPFLDQLDQEVAACYSKASYPGSVRRTLMELNRAVCIDLPEADVPWFHEKYCREQANMNGPKMTLFHSEIARCLNVVLNGEEYYRNHTYTPYYHPIDFEILMDDKRRPVSKKDEKSGVSYQRVAIQAIPTDVFTTHTRNLTGPYQLRHRQLEVLGYRVLGIPYHLWNSLPLSSLEAKLKYLRHKLQLNQ